MSIGISSWLEKQKLFYEAQLAAKWEPYLVEKNQKVYCKNLGCETFGFQAFKGKKTNGVWRCIIFKCTIGRCNFPLFLKENLIEEYEQAEALNIKEQLNRANEAIQNFNFNL